MIILNVRVDSETTLKIGGRSLLIDFEWEVILVGWIKKFISYFMFFIF